MIKSNSNKKIGDRLKECREEKGITQQNLANSCFCTPQTISYIENGKRGLSRDLAHKIASILEICEEYLLLESDFKTTSDKIKFEEELIDYQDTSVMKYLHSRGHTIVLNFPADKSEELCAILDYYYANNIPITQKKITHFTYGNSACVTINNKSAKIDNVTVSIDGAEVDLIDYLDIIEDLNEYADLLLSKAKTRKKRRETHIAIEYQENEIRSNKSCSLQEFVDSLEGKILSHSEAKDLGFDT